MYAEAAGEKFSHGPFLFNCLISRQDQEYPESELGVNFNQGMTFAFFRDDLVDSMYVPEVGDIVLYQEGYHEIDGYYEVDNITANQYFMGKNPDYPNQPGNWNPDLEDFGSNISVICETHYVPADRVGITQERLI